jgi:hypothetical protein
MDDNNDNSIILEHISDISDKIHEYKSFILNEESTKNSIILPFLSIVLGYDIYNPKELIPEYDVSLGVKKSDRIDYALNPSPSVLTKPQIIIECKPLKCDVRNYKDLGQLMRYFSAVNAKFAVLTNGDVYEVFTDNDRDNIMDPEPFCVFSVSDFKPACLEVVKCMSKEFFSIERLTTYAQNLMLFTGAMTALNTTLNDLDPEFTKIVFKKIPGHEHEIVSSKKMEFYRTVLRKATSQWLNNQMQELIDKAKDLSIPPKEQLTLSAQSDQVQYIVRYVDRLIKTHDANGSVDTKKTNNGISLFIKGNKNMVLLHVDSSTDGITIYLDTNPAPNKRDWKRFYLQREEDIHEYGPIIDEAISEYLAKGIMRMSSSTVANGLYAINRPSYSATVRHVDHSWTILKGSTIRSDIQPNLSDRIRSMRTQLVDAHEMSDNVLLVDVECRSGSQATSFIMGSMQSFTALQFIGSIPALRTNPFTR